MLRQFVKHVGGRSDRIATQIEAESGLLSCGNEAVSSGLVTRNVHIASGHLLLRLDAIDIDSTGVSVMTVVVAGLHHLDVILCDGGLLGEFFFQEIGHEVQVAVEEPAYKAKGKHVATLQDGLVVHASISQTVLHHRGQWALNDAVGVDAHLTEVVLCLELCFLQILGAEGIGVDDNGGTGLGIAILHLQRSGIHSYQHVALITRGVDLTRADVYLKT